MKTGEPDCALGAVFPSAAAFRVLQQPHRGRREALCRTRRNPGVAIPTVLLRSPRPARPVLV